ncbi:MAG TPA: diguanylate cyclase [Gammaproteobacteria bacterium]|nr:diguanylate cyclase [Gammaproteobacteria bacterium]
MTLPGWLTGADGPAGLPWDTLYAGLSGLLFAGVAVGVAGWTRRWTRSGDIAIGWAFALLLGTSGLLLLAGPFVSAADMGWVRTGQLFTAPLALLLMAAFLARLWRLEGWDEYEQRAADLEAGIRYERQRLERLREENAELARQGKEALRENDRLASERDLALAEARALQTRDEDTGLYTRTHFVQRLREEFERTHRRGQLPSPLFIALRGLPDDNPEHRAELLSRTGRILREELRMPDLACQFADAEFLVIPCETDVRGTAALARRLYKQIKRALARAGDGGDGTPDAVFVLVTFELNLQRFEDFLEACERSVEAVRRQPAGRLNRIPAPLNGGTDAYPSRP